MKQRTILISLAIVTVVGVAVYVARQNVVVRNFIHVLAYDRVLDRYAQTDTTTTSVVGRIDAFGREAAVLSAFFGLDDGLPNLAGIVSCEGAGGKDGMPVIFSHEVDTGTIDPGDFKVLTASGQTGVVSCLTMAPADDPGELRTALLVGQFGSIDDQPVTVEVVGNILSLDGTLNFRGSQVAVTPLEVGPTFVWAEVVALSAGKLGAPGTAMPWGGGTGCPVETRQIVRVAWGGGVSRADGEAVGDVERRLYAVTVENADGSVETLTPFALADLSDGDNNHELCLDTERSATAVSFPAGHLVDPRGDLNPATVIGITRNEPRNPMNAAAPQDFQPN